MKFTHLKVSPYARADRCMNRSRRSLRAMDGQCLPSQVRNAPRAHYRLWLTCNTERHEVLCKTTHAGSTTVVRGWSFCRKPMNVVSHFLRTTDWGSLVLGSKVVEEIDADTSVRLISYPPTCMMEDCILQHCTQNKGMFDISWMSVTHEKVPFKPGIARLNQQPSGVLAHEFKEGLCRLQWIFLIGKVLRHLSSSLFLTNSTATDSLASKRGKHDPQTFASMVLLDSVTRLCDMINNSGSTLERPPSLCFENSLENEKVRTYVPTTSR